MTHTPLPWELFKYGDHAPEHDYPGKIIGANGQAVFNGPFSFRALRGATDEEAQSNAEYIVKACNSYPAMLEALRRILWALESHLDGSKYVECGTLLCPCYDNEITKTRTLLATIDSETMLGQQVDTHA